MWSDASVIYFKCWYYIISIIEIIPCGATFYESKALNISPLVANSIWNTCTVCLPSSVQTTECNSTMCDTICVPGFFDFLLVVCNKYHCALTKATCHYTRIIYKWIPFHLLGFSLGWQWIYKLLEENWRFYDTVSSCIRKYLFL